MSSSHVSKRDMLQLMKMDDDAVGELLTITRALVNMLELLSDEPEIPLKSGQQQQQDGNTANPFDTRRKSKDGKQRSTSKGNNNNSKSTYNPALLQRVHSSIQVDHYTCPSIFPSLLQRIRSPFDRSELAMSRTLRAFHIEPDTSDIARCVMYSGEAQRQLQQMFTLAGPEGSGALQAMHRSHSDPESLAPARATGVASAASSSAENVATKLLCRRRGTTNAPSAPLPSNEIMLSVPAVRVRHNRGLNPVIVTITPTHLHVRDPLKDFVQKLPWSHLTSATLGNAPGLHAFFSSGSAKQSLANITVGPRHGILWMMARHEAQQSQLPVGERKKLNMTSAQAMKQSLHCINLQFSGMNVLKDSPVPVDTSRMTTHHINELWRFEIVCECEDDFALFCTFLTMVGNYQSALNVVPGLQPFTLPQTPLDRPPKVAQLKLRPTTLPEIDAAVPGGLAAWGSQQDGGGAKKVRSTGPATIALSEAFFRMAHTDKYSRPVTLRYSTRADIPTGIGSSTSHVALQSSEIDFCTENHIGRVEYLVLKQLLLGDPLARWISIADVLGHMLVPLRAWNLSPAVKLLRFWQELGWIERVLVLEPGPRRKN